LWARGASERDVKEFFRILTTVHPTAGDLTSINMEFSADMPFEGGIEPIAALICLCNSMTMGYPLAERIANLPFTMDYENILSNWFDTETPKQTLEVRKLLEFAGLRFKEINERRTVIYPPKGERIL